MSQDQEMSGYVWGNNQPTEAHTYLLPILFEVASSVRKTLVEKGKQPRLFDLGCGNGSVAAAMHDTGWQVTGVDPSKQGIEVANAAFPHLRLSQGSAYEPLWKDHGQFPLVISLEVVEHLYAPRDFAKTLFDLVEPGGTIIVSTPYHGYWKNLALAISGNLDAHFTALWDHGHIKFWSIRTLSMLLKEAGFSEICIRRAGRIKPLAKSMIAIARR